MKLSNAGAAFIARHEGFVSRAYRDPVGVVTIGTGFTNRSQAFSQYWRNKHGRKMRMGDRISKAENDRLLKAVADSEYGAAVNRHIKPSIQHHYDGATSVCFNLGPGAAKWKWAQALKINDVAKSARLLRSTGTTAGGRRLRGLVRRRKEEARLIESADYGHGPVKHTKAKGTVALWAVPLDLEEKRAITGGLLKAGYKVGTDPERPLLLEVERFQRNNGLEVDGLIGPATIAKLQRLQDITNAGKTAGSTGAAGGATAGGGTQLPPDAGFDATWLIWGGVGLIVVALGVFAFIAWKRGWHEEIGTWWRNRT